MRWWAPRATSPRPRPDTATPPGEIAVEFPTWFAERGRGWSLGVTSWAGGDDDLIAAAQARGMAPLTDMPGMVCEARLPEVAVPEGIEIREITADADAAAFVAMIDRAYTSLGLPEGVLASMAPSPGRIAPGHEVTVGAFEGATLLSGAQVLFSHGIAGVYAVGTAEAARGRGLAELVTRTVTNRGFDGGAPVVTLQASSMGEPIYRRMGYRELYRCVNLTRFV